MIRARIARLSLTAAVAAALAIDMVLAARRDRWILPCGGGSVTVTREWQRPARFIVPTHDPARPIYVQRG